MHNGHPPLPTLLHVGEGGGGRLSLQANFQKGGSSQDLNF